MCSFISGKEEFNLGSALGPDWHEGMNLKAAQGVSTTLVAAFVLTSAVYSVTIPCLLCLQFSRCVHIEMESEVKSILLGDEFRQLNVPAHTLPHANTAETSTSSDTGKYFKKTHWAIVKMKPLLA